MEEDVPLELVDEPERPARTDMSDDGLQDLVTSIRDLGLLQAVHLLRKPGGRYEVIAGHRRLLAHRILQRPTIRAVVRDDAGQVHAVRIHENVIREDLAPLDEAVYYAERFEAVGDVDLVATEVRRSRAHVEGRLELLKGWPAVLDALKSGSISIGVAQAFNALEAEEDVTWYLEHARKGGCSVRLAREWVAQANARRAIPPAPSDDGTPQGQNPQGVAPAAPAGPLYASMAQPHELSASTTERECLFCGLRHEEWRMFREHVCEGCANTHLVRIKGGGSA